MDIVYAAIRTDVSSNDVGRQTSALLVALQLAAAGKDISSLAPTICSEVVASSANAVSKKLAFDAIRITRVTADLWEVICRGIKNDLSSVDPDVKAASMAFVSAIPSWRVGEFLTDNWKEISNCIVQSDSVNLREAAVEGLGCLLARDDIVTLCAESASLLDRVSIWWRQIGQSMLDVADPVSSTAFEAVGRLFAEFSTKRLSRLAGEKLIPTESSLAVRSQFVLAMCQFVWSKRDLLMARSQVLPLETLRSTVYPLVYAVRATATGMVDSIKGLVGHDAASAREARRSQARADEQQDFLYAERILGVSDVVSHLNPYLASLDPALVYEVGIHMLSLASVPGGKPEWASAPITAFLTLWDRQEYAAGKEAIVKAVVSNLQLLDLQMQVALFKRLLSMVRNLRMEVDRMHALACICRTALCVDLFVKESARRGQRPLQGTDVAALFEDDKLQEEFSSTTADSLFREELLACLAESCFQLSQPLPQVKSVSAGSTVLGALALGTGHEVNWSQSALEVLEVCRACVRWDCQGRTYAVDGYLRLLVRLCHLYDTAGGVKSVREGAAPEQVQAEQRLHSLQRQLLNDLPHVATPRVRVRVLWALTEHVSLGKAEPLFADEPSDALNMLVSALHRLLFNADGATAATTNRLQDVQALLVAAQHLGTRSFRAAALVARELEDFRRSSMADSVNMHQCRQIISLLAHIQRYPERQWAARIGATGEYPFSHHKLSVQHNESAAALDRKLHTLVATAIQDLWRPSPSELDKATGGSASDGTTLAAPASAGSGGGGGSSSLLGSGGGKGALGGFRVLSGSSDPVLVEAFHLTDEREHRVTLHLKLLNMTELDLTNVDVRVGLMGALTYMDAAPQAVRQLRHLSSQEPVLADVTASIARFERCALCVQLIYNPSDHALAAAAALEDGGEFQEAPGDEASARARRKLRNQVAEPVTLRCRPYRVPLTQLLLPYECSPVEFFRTVSSLPARAEHAGMYQYESSSERSVVLGADEMGVRRLLSGLRALDAKPLYKVCAHLLRSRAGFQLCYMAKTWYGDVLSVVVFGISDISPDGGLGDELTSMLCKFVLCSSSQHVLDEILAEPQEWLDDLTDGALSMVTEEELQEEAREKQRRMHEQIKFLRENMKPTTDGIPLPGLPLPEDLEAEVPVIPEEQHALQIAVLQGWSALRAQQLEIEQAASTAAEKRK